jgi:hypothetical protein
MAVKALQTDWDQSKILDRAKHFSFPHFREELMKVVGQ